MSPWFEIASALFAGLAAALWFVSARVETPKQFRIEVQVPAVPSHLVIGPFSDGLGRSEEINELGRAVARQSRWSAFAAGSAGLSATCQAIALILQRMG
jgi:hypothetical protein